MAQVYLIDVPNEFGVKGLIGDGKLLKFNFSGTCLGEFPIPYNNMTLQEVDVLSVMVADNNVEVGYNMGQTFTKKETLIGLADIARKIDSIKGLIFIGIKDGNNSGVKYSQYIYTFLKGSLSTEIFI
jgi:hypothetical protein